MNRRPLVASAALASAALTVGAALVAPGAASAHPDPHGASAGSHASAASLGDAFTTKTPYAPQQNARSYQKPPAGFTAVLTENVSRHGSRAISDSDDGDALLALLDEATAAHALTPAGRGLADQVHRVLDANAAIGYGQLSSRGVDELEGTAERTAARLPGLFASAARGRGVLVDVSSSSQQRAHDSAQAYVAGLEGAVPGLSKVVGATTTDDATLYFHKSDPAYKAYLKDPRIGAAEDAAVDQPRTHAVARAALERSFTLSFVARLAAGRLASFGDEVAAAQALYAIVQSSHDLPAEDTRGLHLDRYLTRSQAAWFGYLDDVTSFYENGPAFAGSDVTYRMADVLLDDMFATLEAKRAGTSDLVAKLRFTHAEEIMPLASLLGLPGATVQQRTGDLFTYANNPFRGAEVAPMAANVQWDLFRKGDRYLVRMLDDEKETAFKASCKPVAKGSTFYDLDELESCYGWSAGS
ncbi:histidine-type phosphatase [Luteimicrobium sp. DT211]|uniref:histidine-type phosphatase n=1 Tax=Luteimicrobium sp. DT211 TaxID=3393412 RepID=UPI003CE77F29